IIAGSDSGGGAGIQAYIKTVTVLGGYAMTAITALTAQNTQGVQAVYPIPPDFITQEITSVMDDIGADCIKTGMLHSTEVIEAVADALQAHAPDIPLVLDPVMIAKGGAPLLQPKAVETLKRRLLPRATLITPNIPEAELLTGLKITDPDSAEEAGNVLCAMGAGAVLVKGGHLPGKKITNTLVHRDNTQFFMTTRYETTHTHGTGCTLAAAIATGIAQQNTLESAVEAAIAYVDGAIRHAPGLGHGHGPLNHNWR
ncbi:MAG: bifunctional hydroxymethylpyrimidine kinase/phosphomethylpyrimidine kinase, partial [Rickettsiales bacterium]|nr:bifunctional hydroxymethylpyrimidine kinase/phosphomethylpyrimidine kinase [Rickettsiales bacterium]